jgi:hypothetical protein
VALAAVLIASAGGPTEEGLVPSLPTLLVYPVLMGIFHFQEMSARGSAEDGD